MRSMRCVGRHVAVQKLAILGVAVHVIAGLRGGVIGGAAFFVPAVLARAEAGSFDSTQDLSAVGGFEIGPDHFQPIFAGVAGHRQEFLEIASFIGDAPLTTRGAGGRK